MSTTSVNINQDNITDECNLICVHNPVVFLVDITYTGTVPVEAFCKIYDNESTLLGTFKCIPYVDVIGSIRRFAFICDSILRGLMDDFVDFAQASNTIEYCDGMTKEFRLKFYAEAESIYDEVNIVALHGVRQFGEDPSAIDIFNNEPQLYIGAENKPIYAYIYNDDIANSIGSSEGESEEVLLDYDDEELADFDDELLTGITT